MNIRCWFAILGALLVCICPLYGASGRWRPPDNERAALRAAITDLTAEFSRRYPVGAQYLAKLDDIGAGADKADWQEFRRNALVENPLVSGSEILFVARRQYRPDHHNTATMFVTGEINTGSFEGGGALKAVDLKQGGVVRTLIQTDRGLIRDPEVHFDGKRIVFAMRRDIRDDYHIYEINADGTGLKQLNSAPGVADFDPLYLPDGSIVFSSTREPKFCMCNRHIMGNLFRMDADGANIHQIGKSTLHEGHSALLDDGRIIYDRWEYVDRNFGDAQGLWTVNPDGTNHALYWGNNTWSPGGVIDARPIPETERIMCVFGSCHDRPWGALAIIDRCLGVDGREPVIRTWPAGAIDIVREKGPGPDAYGFDNFLRVNPKYEDPYPLNDRYFLCSRMTGKGEQMGIYLLDVFGNELLLHSEEPGCFDPMPLAPRRRPQVVPSRRDFENAAGYFYIADIYQGTHMQGVKRGSAKFLRVIESPEKRFWTHPAWEGQGVHCPAVNWHSFESKRLLGIVPIAEDGSVYFETPSDRFVYFQILDENKMMIQSMRSGTIVQSGEQTGCIGCHESRRSAPPKPGNEMPMALRHPPSRLQGWYPEPRMFSYMDEIQPIFDKHCLRCHDYGKEAEDKLLLAGDRTTTFNTSYNELWRKKYIAAIGAGPSDIQPAYSWGSHASKLIKVIRAGHNDVKLSKEEFERIAAWIDLNGPYYPRYDTAYPDNLTGRCPLDNAQVKRLGELTGVHLGDFAGHNRNQGPQVSFDRPSLSPCLQKFKDKTDPQYIEALAIIEAGRQTLAKRPRADMPGFKPCETDRRREEKYAARQQMELRNRRAISMGQKVYDTPAD
ncbi:MAG: PD40 domain-containing protein [Sedimentisphaerales bacterium]|nr:PD40 domain-containing protein [Sedimentisphaerales bacterium]